MLSSTAAAAATGAGKRVAVLGAGAAGLVASRLLREAGFGVRCFEKTDSVGGVWRYRCVDRSVGRSAFRLILDSVQDFTV